MIGTETKQAWRLTWTDMKQEGSDFDTRKV